MVRDARTVVVEGWQVAGRPGWGGGGWFRTGGRRERGREVASKAARGVGYMRRVTMHTASAGLACVQGTLYLGSPLC